MYDSEKVETALCLWEAMLELRKELPRLDREWLSHGTSAMRASVVNMIDECDEAWESLPVDDRDAQSFDWEFCPAFIRGRWT